MREHFWHKTKVELPPEGMEVITKSRHRPLDRTKKVFYVYARCVFTDGKFMQHKDVIFPVMYWKFPEWKAND